MTWFSNSLDWLHRLDKYTILPGMNDTSFENDTVESIRIFISKCLWLRSHGKLFCLSFAPGSFQTNIRKMLFGNEYTYNIWSAPICLHILVSSFLFCYQWYQFIGAVGGKFIVWTFSALLLTDRLNHHLFSYLTTSGNYFCCLIVYSRYIQSSCFQECQVLW